MMSWIKICAIVSVALLVGPSDTAFAHRMNNAMSLVELPANNGRLEVTHSLYAHDLEGVLGAGSAQMNWFETPAGEAALRAYCERNFVLKGSNGRTIALRFIGVELRGDLINVYFDAPRFRGSSLIVDANFLQEVSDSQINQVNVRANGQTVSAVFRIGAEAKSIAIPRN